MHRNRNTIIIQLECMKGDVTLLTTTFAWIKSNAIGKQTEPLSIVPGALVRYSELFTGCRFLANPHTSASFHAKWTMI